MMWMRWFCRRGCSLSTKSGSLITIIAIGPLTHNQVFSSPLKLFFLTLVEETTSDCRLPVLCHLSRLIKALLLPTTMVLSTMSKER
jgi:hypothetical protein